MKPINALIDKQRVRDSFDRAAGTYDGAALVQRLVCDRLLDQFIANDLEPKTILDAGCGTGFGIKPLQNRWPEAHITCVDFALSMLHLAKKNNPYLCAADIEQLPFSAESFDAWWSSLSLQWCEPRRVFSEARRVLRKHGNALFSTLGSGTFFELRDAFSGVDPYAHTLSFTSVDQINAALIEIGFGRITLIREKHTLYYPDLNSLLRAVKAVGANTVGSGARSGMMGRKAWSALETAYERFREPAGLPISYQVILGYAKK